jgi:hypothetical protein
MRGLYLVCAAVLYANVAGAVAQAPREPQDQPTDQQKVDLPIAVSYSLPEDKPTLHEPVVLVFTVANNTSYPIQLDLGHDYKSGFSFSVVDPNGQLHQLRPLFYSGRSGPGTVSVAPGHNYSQKLLLNQWYAFPVPGQYEFKGHLTQPIMVGQGVGRQTDRGFRVVIGVGPRNEAALTATCEFLASEIEGHNNQDAADAALALSYVNDPLAEPYLRSVLLTGEELELIILRGFDRVGDQRSVDDLAEEASSKDLVIKQAASRALFEIRQRTTDAELRGKIDRILAQR